MRGCQSLVIAAVLMFGSAGGVRAADCPVPTGTHPTIQSAVDDPACTSIELSAQTFLENITIDRDLAVAGESTASSIVVGRIVISGSTSAVSMADLTVSGCFLKALDVSDGASLTGTNLVVVNGIADACPIFGDGFEDGSTGAWSATVP